MLPRTLTQILIAVTAVAAFALGHSASANLVANPGFQTGDFTGWTVGGDASGSGVDEVGRITDFAAVLRGFDTGITLAQTIPTVPGAGYDFRMWFAHIAPSNSFQIFWNGRLLDAGVFTSTFDYFQSTYSGLVATEPLTEIKFIISAAGTETGSVLLDDVSVIRSGAGVPEPFSTLWLALPFAVMVGFRRSRNKTVSSLA